MQIGRFTSTEIKGFVKVKETISLVKIMQEFYKEMQEYSN